MQPKTPKLLADIADAATFILASVHGKVVDDYRANRQLRQAIERNFEIIGEAANRLARTDPDVSARVSNAARIVAFRNLLIHGYDMIDDAQVWSIIVESVPVLLGEVLELLNE